MAAYKIGNFTFDTEEEYARGLEDAKKIEKIQNTVDLNEPETALRLYWLIRTGKIKFGSKVGKKIRQKPQRWWTMTPFFRRMHRNLRRD